MDKEFKMAVHAACLSAVEDRVNTVKTALDAAQSAANNETKSSAGDKYETGRAMMHLEREKLTLQLSEALALERAMLELKPEKELSEIGPGALVRAGQSLFYVAVGMGKIKCGGRQIYAISPVSPIGKLMRGKRGGEGFELNGKRWEIEEFL